MIRRCTQPSHDDYPNYGGRGITVCARWLSFENFLADMGERPPGKTLDRKDNSLGYAPENCRWATPMTQNRNSRHCKLTLDNALEVLGRLEYGERVKDVAERFGITAAAVSMIKTRRAWLDLEPYRAPNR